MHRLLESLRQRLAKADAVLPLAAIGAVSGALTGAVIVAFRALTEWPLVAGGLLSGPESFEDLDPLLRLCLPIAGGLVIGVAFQFAAVGSRQVGVVHVMDRLAYHAGRLPWRNAVLQFFGGALSLLSGHSVGLEGPVIHVGAASASLMGQWSRLPNNSLRTLVACGVSAGIAASFNTPIAGVILAMEVVMMEYTLVGFTPVILSAVTATSLSRAAFGAEPAFAVPSMQMGSLWELPAILAAGIVMGTLAAAFIWSVRALDARTRHLPLWWRTTAAGAVTGLAALAAPEVMGVGYDTVEATLLAEFAPWALALVLAFKLLATTACVSLGLPGGLIGPTLVIGAAAGGVLAFCGQALDPHLFADAGFYAMLGMGAMMGAALQAPLAALMAILELTANPNIILPGMLAIVGATLTSRVAFRQDSIFVMLLATRGLEYRNDPVAVALERIGVSAVMSRQVTAVSGDATAASLRAPLERPYEWVLVLDAQARVIAPVAADRLRAGVEQTPADSVPEALHEAVAAPGRFAMVRLHATLREALDQMDRLETDFTLVTRTAVPLRSTVYGVLTREQIESGVRYRSR